MKFSRTKKLSKKLIIFTLRRHVEILDFAGGKIYSTIDFVENVSGKVLRFSGKLERIADAIYRTTAEYKKSVEF